jgi:hypothetical protein
MITPGIRQVLVDGRNKIGENVGDYRRDTIYAPIIAALANAIAAE